MVKGKRSDRESLPRVLVYALLVCCVFTGNRVVVLPFLDFYMHWLPCHHQKTDCRTWIHHPVLMPKLPIPPLLANGKLLARGKKVMRRCPTFHSRNMCMDAVKHDLKSLNEYDPRPMEYRGKAQGCLPGFLSKVKGKGLGVSVLFDPEGRVWKLDGEAKATLSDLPSKDVLVKRVAAFKESLKLTPERSTVDQSQSPIWYSARRYRLAASTFGRIFHMLPSTPPDCLVKQLLHPQNFSTKLLSGGSITKLLLLISTLNTRYVMVTQD